MGRIAMVGALVSVVVGLAVAGVGGYMYYDQRQAVENAVVVDGAVLESDVRASLGGVNDHVDHYPEIRYRYTYEGRSYVNDEVFPGPGQRSVTEGRAHHIASRYGPGERVAVYVPPDEPSESFLIKDSPEMFPLYIGGAGAVFAFVGAASFLREVF